MPRPSMSRYRPSCPDESFAQEADGAVLLPPWARAAVRRAFARSLGAVRSLWRGAQRIAWAPAVLMCGCSSTPAASSDSGSSTKAAALGHVFGEGGGGAPGVAPPSSCLVGAASGNLARCVNSRDCGPGSRCNTALSVPSCELVYCGTPGTLCSSDDVCEQGLRCYQSKCTRCDVCGDRCEVDFDNDPKNCGTCGHAVFSNAHQSCSGGQVTCPDGQTVCGYECADLRTSLSSCGECGRAAPERGRCVDGAPRCDPGETVCGSMCFDLQTHPMNCGACGRRVPAGRSCVNGAPAP